MDTYQPSADQIIASLGGITATANLFEITPPSVHEWKANGIPKARLMYLKLARPELFTRSPSQDAA